jgi:hypothetical protein
MSTPIEQALADAVRSLSTNQFTSIRAAAKYYAVDRTTLTRRLRGGLSHVEAAQPSLLLSTEQERLLVRWILDLERAGHPPNYTQIREFTELICQASGTSIHVGIN